MLEYIDALKLKYNSYIILPFDGSMSKTLEDRMIPYSIIPQYGWVGKNKKGSIVKLLMCFIRNIIALNASKRLILETKPSFVCTNTIIPFVAAKAAFKLGIPHIWWIHEYGEEDFGFKIGNGKPLEAYKKMQRWSKLVICNSNSVKMKFKELLPTVLVERLYQPVSWQVSSQLLMGNEAEYLMFGQIINSKGHLEVLEAIALSSKSGYKVHLHIKGPCEDINYLDQLNHFISANGLNEQVKIETGFYKKEEEIPKYKVLIVASRSEAFGRVIVEAHKAGLNVIVKNSGGAPELVNGTNGILYETIDELCAIFCGKTSMPKKVIRHNYSETNELKRLIYFLESIA